MYLAADIVYVCIYTSSHWYTAQCALDSVCVDIIIFLYAICYKTTILLFIAIFEFCLYFTTTLSLPHHSLDMFLKSFISFR